MFIYVCRDALTHTITVVLGNAYLSLYFMSNQDPNMLKQCVSAYTQAVSSVTSCTVVPSFATLSLQEKDPVAANNPDLHFNKATVSN